MKHFYLLCLFIGCFVVAKANNAHIKGSATLADSGSGIFTIGFNLSWDNSWRDNENWDAVWIFVKFRKDAQSVWNHGNLALTGHSASDNIGATTFNVEAGLTDDNLKATGVFVHRSLDGAGNVSCHVSLNCTFSDFSIAAADLATLQVDVFACEMVYVPEKAYYLGDGASTNSFKEDVSISAITAAEDIIGTDSNFKYFSLNSAARSPSNPNYVADRTTVPYGRGYDYYSLVTESGNQGWRVDFGRGNGKTIRAFAAVVYNGAGYYLDTSSKNVPWKLEASNDNVNWNTLWAGLGQYVLSSTGQYPIQSAIQVNNVNAYEYYRINANVSSNLLLFNVSMTEVYKPSSGLCYPEINGEGVILASSFYDLKWWVKESTVPASYPKGYKAFYCMKYELTQEQYVDFLNKLTYSQQNKLTVSTPLSASGSGALTALCDYRNGVRNFIVAPNSTTPAKYGLDLDGNGVFFESTDGGNIACNYLSGTEALAYADWAGLRPMTELEFEKAARGSALPEPGENAWSDVTQRITGFSGGTEGAFDEIPDNSANVNCAFDALSGGIEGPVRVGAFATANSNRVSSGASFWGIMELSGNLWEITVPLSGNTSSFTGNHGDGLLNSDGTYSVGSWPATSSLGLRGGSWSSPVNQCGISDRSKAVGGVSAKLKDVGFRAVRTAPVP